MSDKDKSRAIVLIEKLRLVEAEIFRLASKYGVKSVDELDSFISKGKVTEKKVEEDLFVFDFLISQKKELEKETESLSINKADIWKNLQNLLELPKLNFRT
ncbi:hypothetical protein COY13_03425 [Candidatus Roizmanbacteria bacterium CG_4_10_14_0_2_um_filter_36_35]|uniref:Uncharacterized protein n=4 Tax=Candidatus Roizmaniibacteriota TaxID=1752723 RepID=A0A2M8F4J6_9BACT|nr:MAG: hypothetical protein COX47_04250 [Candidatus Roizmanbacteria bacterium CG23_combo_of_CG06-09_8_20_14_all_35_49]PIP62989.1 MAG: hypothetical protein COW98_01095 [Candidatus Roizmanbacteria bacterium CG22_combo_CG10-13_8_21_14_all_35_9]PIZ67330.1 MAG: hypothetical protein COY13_03425 [Candidatus Roizmanbacteria bacterium CG_4_10_14_0_2_um_filter_36_35]PJC34198.1 MAG: hypothetical protein CO048_00975 [Candidatus Roizmanbacteria bacterium CG_4_9_14_0_2_um_filter_35_15]PJC82698.1 MAG: hypoth